MKKNQKYEQIPIHIWYNYTPDFFLFQYGFVLDDNKISTKQNINCDKIDFSMVNTYNSIFALKNNNSHTQKKQK